MRNRLSKVFKRINIHSILIKYILSYLIILLVPLSIFSYMLYRNAVLNVEKNVESSAYYKLSQVRDMIDLKISQLEYTANKIDTDPRLIPFTLLNDPYEEIDCIRRLKIYKGTDEFMNELYLYYRGKNTVYGSSGVVSLDVLLNDSYNFTESSRSQLFKDINTAKKITVKKVDLEGEKKSELLFFIYPLPLMDESPDKIAIFFIRNNVFHSMIQGILGDIEGSVILFNRENAPLVSLNYGEEIPSTVILDELENKNQMKSDSSLFNFNFDNNDFSMVYVSSDKNEWKYAMVMPTKQFKAKALHMKNIVVFSITGVLATGIGLAFILAFGSYRPVKNTIDIMSKFTGNKITKDKNEFQNINEIISNVYSSNQKMKERMKVHKPLIRQQVLIKLLSGKYSNIEEIEDVIDYLSINLNASSYCVMCIDVSGLNIKSISANTGLKLTELLEEFLGGKNEIHAVDIAVDSNIALICSINNEEKYRQQQAETCEKVKTMFDEYYGVIPVIGVGGICSDISMINRSYVEAHASLEYKIVKSKEVIFFEDIGLTDTDSNWYPVQEQIRFIHSLKLGDSSVAVENLNKLMSSISVEHPSLLKSKYICFDIVNMVAKAINELKIDALTEELEDLMRFDAVSDLKIKLKSMTEKICYLVKKIKEDSNNQQCEKILEYINHNFTDNCLSLDYLAEKFAISPYHINKFFKERAKSSFNEYTKNLRIKEAQRLLVETKLKMKDIVEKIGYIDTPNFMRKFKKLEGITMDNYRKMNKKNPL
jgi:two-component system, response regulator YesN